MSQVSPTIREPAVKPQRKKWAERDKKEYEAEVPAFLGRVWCYLSLFPDQNTLASEFLGDGSHRAARRLPDFYSRAQCGRVRDKTKELIRPHSRMIRHSLDDPCLVPPRPRLGVRGSSFGKP